MNPVCAIDGFRHFLCRFAVFDSSVAFAFLCQNMERYSVYGIFEKFHLKTFKLLLLLLIWEFICPTANPKDLKSEPKEIQKSQTSTKNSENPKRILNILTIQKQPKNPKNPVYKVCPIWERSFACTLHAYILREWCVNASFDVHNLVILAHSVCTTAWTLMLPKLVILDLRLKRQNKSF